MKASTPSFLIALTICATLAGSADGAADMQENERLALGFVDRVAEGDADAVLEYMTAHFAESLLDQRPLDQWRGLAERLLRHAGLEVVGIEVQPARVAIEAESPTGMRVRFGFDFTDEEPGKISELQLRAGGSSAAASSLPPFEPPTGDDAGVRDALARYLDALDRDGLFSGAILVARDGEPVFEDARGLASREWEIPNTLDTRFGLGSINKSFTKIAIAQLVLTGELSLDDTIAQHLPDYPNPDVARRVTVRQLVEHTSGIGDIFNDRFFRSSRSLYREPVDFFPVFAHDPLLFEPGEGSAYSNGGYMVLGAIVAAVSGKTYSEYVHENIFEPAGMTATGFFARDEIHPRIAVGYTRMGPDGPGGELRNNLFMLPVRGSSAGNAYSTVGDMLKFDEAVREHRLLPPSWTHWYFGGHEPAEQDPERISTARNMSAVGIAGGAPGVSAVMESDGRLTVIVLANEDEPGAEALARVLREPLSRALGSTAP